MIGILNDKGMNDAGVMVARIDEKPYEVLSYVLPFLEKLEKGSQVEATLNKDHKISKIQRAKGQQRDKAGFGQLPDGTKEVMTEAEQKALLEQSAEAQKRKAAGFGIPSESTVKAPEGGIAGIVAATKERMAQEERKDCTSPITPTTPSNSTGLKTIEGQITAINHEKRGIAVKDREGITHPFYWTASLDESFGKLKQWWFTKITGELQGENWIATSQSFFRKPDDWPSSGGQGKRQWQPRNERLIVFQCTYKECAETARHMLVIPDSEFKEDHANGIMDWVFTSAVTDAKALIAAEKEMQ